MRHPFTITIFASVSLIGCASPGVSAAPGEAATAARVLQSGCPTSGYSTVQEAIDNAVDDDIVEVCAGTYEEHLDVYGKRITLRGIDGADVTIIDATWSGQALAVGAGAELTVEDLTFTHGVAGGDGGNIYCDASGLVLQGSVVNDGSATNGGGLAATDCWGMVSSTEFTGNSGNRGGGAWVSGSDLAFEGNTLSDNHATWAGGGLFTNGSVPVSGNLLTGNDSDLYGGGMYANDHFGTIEGNNVVGNTSMNDGGGIYVQSGAPVVAGNMFTDNVAEDEAGGLRLKESSGTVLSNVFTNNHADYRGGAIKISHDSATLSGNRYIGNSTWVTGGAVFLYESPTSMDREYFEGNTAQYGGGIGIIDPYDRMQITNSRFIGNEATDDGGNVYLEDVSRQVTLARVLLQGGEADRGGGLFAVRSEVRLLNVAATKNMASVEGGGFFLEEVAGQLTNAVLFRNDAPVGAGVAVIEGADVDITNTIFHGNLDGAAVSVVWGGSPTVTYSSSSRNGSDWAEMQLSGTGNVAASPRFVAPGANNFRLSPTSPLIDAGDPAILDNDDTISDVGIYGGPVAL